MNRYRLTLRSLKFLSAVDFPAQEPAVCVLTKRANAAPDVKASYRVCKMDEELGVVIGMSIVTSVDGVPYSDLQGDAVQEQDLLKTVVGFMEQGAPTDTQHNRETDGRVVLSWVFDQETNDALEVKSRKFGWATGLKVSKETFAKFKSGEFTGFSIDGEGVREPVAKTAPTKVVKAQLVTDEVDGHAHTVEICEGGEMWTSWATAAGAESGHQHAVTLVDGAITILADSGHSHVLAEGQPGVLFAPADVIIVPIQASAFPTKNAATRRAPLSKSPPPIAVRNVDTMKTAEEKLADLQKSHDRLERIAKMSGAHKAHFDTLGAEDAEAFLAKSGADRDAVLKTAADADPVEVEFDGQSFRKSAGPGVIALAKKAKEQAEAIEKAEVRKAAQEHLGNLAGDDDTHDLIVRSLRKSGAKAEDIGKAFTAMKGWNALAKSKQTAPGFGGTAVDENADAQERLDAMTLEYAQKNNVDRPAATAAIMKTAEGRRLYAESVGR